MPRGKLEAEDELLGLADVDLEEQLDEPDEAPADAPKADNDADEGLDAIMKEFEQPTKEGAELMKDLPVAAPIFKDIEEPKQVPGSIVGKVTETDLESDATEDLERQPLDRHAFEIDRSDRPKKPLWAVWPSRSKFFCRGFCMTGGETELGITSYWSVPNLCVWTCILAPCSLYFLWVFPHLWRQGSYAMPLATLSIFLITTGSLLATCCTDPGVLPRREVVVATRSADRLEAQLGYDLLARKTVPVDGSGGGRNLPVDLTSRGFRWCRTCRIVRPPRASHCPDCDNCVLRYDHHCPFVNNCVGQRNYHFFFGFVTSVLCLATMVLPVLFWFLNSDNFEASIDAMTTVSSGVLQPIFIILISAGALIGIAVFLSAFLWIYHVFLIATKRTTKEYRRNIENLTEEPTLCASRGPRLFDPFDMVDPQEIIRKDEVAREDSGGVCSACWGGDDD